MRRILNRVFEPYRGIGIRIEDDLLVTESGHEVLTGALPTDPEMIEAMVGSGSTDVRAGQ